MVQLPTAFHSHRVEDFTEEEYGSLSKRHRSAAAAPPLNRWGSTNHEFTVPPPQYNALDEPSPLGLRLKKTPSLLDLIQMRLSQTADIVKPRNKKNVKGSAPANATDKLKASNFMASVLRIGSWEYKSRYEGDLVAKCYFAKHKLVWEVLEGGLKSKIEMQWSDIVALKANCSDNKPGSLTIMLARQPVFFRETNPQPRKHTLWQASSDFTDGQASLNRLHYIECPPGVLNKHYEKLIQCDMRLGTLSQQPEKIMDSPYFEESEASLLENPEECKGNQHNQLPAAAIGSPSFAFADSASVAAVQLSSFSLGQNSVAAQYLSNEVPSPSSVMDTNAIERSKTVDAHPKSWERLVVPGIHHSMSISDLLDHVGNCISEELTSGNIPSHKASECQRMLENISQVLLSDTQVQHTSGLDEKSLMKKVNSLCCLLEDPAMASNAQVNGGRSHCESASSNLINDSSLDKHCAPLQRKDSLADLLLHLPRITSLPKFLSGIMED